MKQLVVFIVLFLIAFFPAYSQGKNLKWQDIDEFNFDQMDSEDAVMERRELEEALRTEPPEEVIEPAEEEKEEPEAIFPDLPENTEIHVIGVYEGAPPVGGVIVHVEKQRTPIVLVLTAHEFVRWNVIKNAGVIIKGVILSGAKKQTLFGLGKKIPRAYIFGAEAKDKYFYAYKKGDSLYSNMEASVSALTGKAITSFQGEYKAKSKYIIR